MSIRIHLDECVHRGVADALRRRGIEITSAVDAGLLRASDIEHLEFARAQQRVLFTHDVDFIRLHAVGARHCGIVFCANQARTIQEMVRGLELLCLTRTPEEMVGVLGFL